MSRITQFLRLLAGLALSRVILFQGIAANLDREIQDLASMARETVAATAENEDPLATTRPAEILSHRVAPREALEVARYVTHMTAQLEKMAVAAGLDLLAYFLGMVKAEGDLSGRGDAQADRVESEGPVGPQSHDDNPSD